jgi:hypothetical protein
MVVERLNPGGSLLNAGSGLTGGIGPTGGSGLGVGGSGVGPGVGPVGGSLVGGSVEVVPVLGLYGISLLVLGNAPSNTFTLLSTDFSTAFSVYFSG